MLSKVDHPQFHPTTVKRKLSPGPVANHKVTGPLKQEWRGGAKVRKR